MFVPREGVAARALRLLRWLFTARGRELFALYRAQPCGNAGDLLGKNPLRDPRHPGNAFRLADLLAPLRQRELHVYSSTFPANVALGAAHLLGVPLSISSYVDFEFPYARFFRVVSRSAARGCASCRACRPCPTNACRWSTSASTSQSGRARRRSAGAA
ncbi:MAG: hypothetical protein FJ265_19440 [Planctomycetes bacterium]|nr:hypothetical protein [Planctomycetota bacterium]